MWRIRRFFRPSSTTKPASEPISEPMPHRQSNSLSLPDFSDHPPSSDPNHSDVDIPVEPVLVAKSHARLHCLRMDHTGIITETYLTRTHLLNEARQSTQCNNLHTLPLQASDIRQVDPAFDAKSALWVRHAAIVVSIEGMRAIILKDKMLVFDPTKQNTQRLLSVVQLSVTNFADLDANVDHTFEQPFEFRALEGILTHVNTILEGELQTLRPAIENNLESLRGNLNSKMLEELRSKKQELNHFHSRASSLKSILEGLLDEDEDMAAMYLNECRKAEDHQEVELLLEAFLQVIDHHVMQAELLKGAVDDTEDLVSIHLDTLRNRLLSMQLTANIVAMMFSLGGVIFGMFGMNIQIGVYEEDRSKRVFEIVIACTFGGSALLLILVFWLVRRQGVYYL